MTAALETDIAIVGSGFGGSILAMIARRLGLRVALLEKGTHPRFAIGESASPLAGVILEQIARRYDLPRLEPLATYGAWQRHYARVTCGLKRGFTYYKHTPGERFASRSDRGNELLVAASPDDELSDTHWLRADVDHFLVREAVALGVEYVDELRIEDIEWTTAGVRLTGTRRSITTRVAARFIVDASGPHGFLSRALGISDAGFGGFPATQALFTHFSGVARCADMPEYAPRPSNGTADAMPYPPDAAALHHLFDEGWMWALRFDNGVTSAGVAVTDALAADVRLGDGEPAWRRLLARYPSIAAQFGEATPIREFTWMPRVAWRASVAAGERWAMLPSAAAFVDPLFSTGIPLTLLGIERLARMFAGRAGGRPLQDVLSDAPWTERRVPASGRPGIASMALDEADHVARYIAGCYAAFPRFDDFVAWSMFYFATASFSEMSRRLHGDEWPGAFMLCTDARLREAMAELSPAKDLRPDLADRVRAAIAPVNVAGLADPGKRNWYGIDVEETVAAAAKLVAAPDRIRAMFSASLV